MQILYQCLNKHHATKEYWKMKYIHTHTHTNTHTCARACAHIHTPYKTNNITKINGWPPRIGTESYWIIHCGYHSFYLNVCLQQQA